MAIKVVDVYKLKLLTFPRTEWSPGARRLQQTQMGQLWAAVTVHASFISKGMKMPQTSSSHFLSTPSKASTSAGRAAA